MRDLGSWVGATARAFAGWVCVALLAIAWRWWATDRGGDLEDLVDDLVTGGVAAAVATVPVVWLWGRRERRLTARRRVGERIERAVSEVVPGQPVVRVRRWSGTSPVRVEVRYQTRAWEGELPERRRELTTALMRSVPNAKWKGTYHPRRSVVSFRVVVLTEAERARHEVERRIEELVRKTLAGTRSVRVREWESETEPVESGEGAADVYEPRVVEATYQPSPRAGHPRYQEIVTQAVGAALPGRWSSEWETEDDRVIFRRRVPLPARALVPTDPVQVDGVVPYAIQEDGSVQVWDMINQPHCLVVGPTGGGKTSTIRTLVVNALRIPGGAELIGLDPKRIELIGLAGYPGVCRIATEPQECADALEDLATEMDRRYRLVMADPSARDRLRPLIAVLDEFFILQLRLNGLWLKQGNKGKHPALMGMPELAALARSARIHLIIGIQRPDAEFLGGAARDNFRHRISLTKLSPEGARMMWGDGSTAGTDLPTRSGRAIATNADGDPVEVQIFWTPETDPRLRDRLTPDDAERLALLLPEQIVDQTEMPQRETVADQTMSTAIAAGLIDDSKQASKRDGSAIETAPAAPADGAAMVTASPANPDKYQWQSARCEELIEGDWIDVDGERVQLIADAEFDPDDEDAVLLEWAEGVLNVPADQVMQRQQLDEPALA